jgi:perosamine synthetase
MDRIMSISNKHDCVVLEDACEGLGATYKGKQVGTIGDYGVFSFNGNKIITTGSGGAIVGGTDYARYICNQAKDDSINYVHNEIGYNYGMTNISAGIGLAQLDKLDEFIEHRKSIYGWYKKYLKVGAMFEYPDYVEPNYWFSVAFVDNPNIETLIERGIECRPIWKLCHEQKQYRGRRAWKIDKAQGLVERSLCLPCNGLTEIGVRSICDVVNEVCK